MKKIKKYNPKKNKVCVGEFLFAVNGKVSKHIFEAKESEEITNAQHGIMNYLFLEVANRWCRCPWCQHRATELIEIINKYEDRAKDIPEKEEA